MSYRKFTKDVGIMALVQLFSALEGIIILPIITKLMGAENYGVWTQLQVTITLAVPLFTLGLPYTLVRFLAGEKEEKEIRDGIWSSLTIISGISFISFFALFVFSEFLSHFFGEGKIFVQLLAFVLLFSCLNELLFNVFRAFQQVKRYAFFFIFQTLGEIGLISLALFYTHSLINAILSLLTIRALIFFIMAFLTIKKIGIAIPRFLRVKAYLAFGLPSIPSNLSTWVVQSSNRYLIGFFLGTLYVGYYNPASMLSSSMTLFIAPLSFVLPAALSKLYDENRFEEIKKYLSYSLKYFLMLSIPSAFGLSVLSRQLLRLFSTAEIADKSYYILPFTAFCILFYGVAAIISQVFVIKKKTRVLGAIWIIAAFLNFGFNLLLIPSMGILGAAIANLSAYAIVLILTWYYCLKEFVFVIDWTFISKSVFASAIMGLCVFWFAPMGTGKTLAVVALGAILYGAVIILLKGFDRKEIELMKGLFKKS